LLYRVAAPRSRLPQSFGFRIQLPPMLCDNPWSPANPSRPTGSRAVARGIFPPQFLHPPFSHALLLALPLASQHISAVGRTSSAAAGTSRSALETKPVLSAQVLPADARSQTQVPRNLAAGLLFQNLRTPSAVLPATSSSAVFLFQMSSEKSPDQKSRQVAPNSACSACKFLRTPSRDRSGFQASFPCTRLRSARQQSMPHFRSSLS